MTRHFLTAAAFVAASFCWSQLGIAQDRSKDDALDKLLEKIDESKKPKSGDEKPAAASEPKDKALDKLLEKIGESREDAAPDGKGPGLPGQDGGTPAPPRPGDKSKGDLEGNSKKLDEHLEELTGRRKKDKNQRESKQSDGSGPLADAIKKMDEVEQRLRKSDTGETTRKTEGEIVKQLDTILEQLRRASSQSQGRRTIRQVRQAGNPGNDPNQQGQQGNTGTGVGPSKPLRPNPKSVIANNKDVWGDLPPALREEMNNVFREEMLPAKRQMIERYYSTVLKKSQSRGE
jgi:hypothetical protein